jgi:DNA-directed RNA polymerase specialized sigma24 family protein
MSDRSFALHVYDLVFHAVDYDDVDVDAILSAVAGLPEPERIALVNRVRHGKLYSEIGVVLGISTERASKTTHRAVHMLRHSSRIDALSIMRRRRVEQRQQAEKGRKDNPYDHYQ